MGGGQPALHDPLAFRLFDVIHSRRSVLIPYLLLIWFSPLSFSFVGSASTCALVLRVLGGRHGVEFIRKIVVADPVKKFDSRLALGFRFARRHEFHYISRL